MEVEIVRAAAAGYDERMKTVGKVKPLDPLELLQQAQKLRERVERWNPWPRLRGKVFKFRTWEALEQWRQNQTNPRLR